MVSNSTFLFLLGLILFANGAVLQDPTSQPTPTIKFHPSAEQKNTSSSSFSNSTSLQKAREAVRNAQASIAVLNIARRANPRRNTNKIWTGNASERNRIAPFKPHPTSDPEILLAAALIAEADAQPMERSGDEKRQSSSFWMEGVTQNGFSPFVPNPATYKVLNQSSFSPFMFPLLV